MALATLAPDAGLDHHLERQSQQHQAAYLVDHEGLGLEPGEHGTAGEHQGNQHVPERVYARRSAS